MVEYFHRPLKRSNEIIIRDCICYGVVLNHGFKAPNRKTFENMLKSRHRQNCI